MWILLLLVGLPTGGSGTPLNTPRVPAASRNDSGLEPHGASPSLALPVTPTQVPPRSEAPALSLNLGLNFKIKVRSQGKGQLGKGPKGVTASPGLLPTHSQAPGSRLWAEAPGGSGWLGPGPAAEELPSGPGGWAWEGSPAHAEPNLLASGPTPQLPLTLWPRLTQKGLAVPVTGEDSRELEFKIDIDLTAGVGKEGSLATNSSGPAGHRLLFPGLRVGIAEIASKLQGVPGLVGSRLPLVTWEPPERNATGSVWEPPGDSLPTPEGASESGPENGSLAASPGSGGAFVALPSCLPDRPENCGSPLPEPGTPPLSALLLPALPLFVPLRSDWNSALAEWGLAWEAHVYGAGSLFALLALLALLGLACLPCRCPASCKLLASLHLLLAGAGGARAVLLFAGDASGELALFPEFVVRLLHDLALPCLTSALALSTRLLSLRPHAKCSGLWHSCWLAVLLPLHFSAVMGAVLAADWLPQFPFLLLASRGLFALLAALFSGSFLVFYCLAQTSDLKGTALPACQCPFDDARQWTRAARTALPAASFGLLSAGLHTYAILHALGYGLNPDLFGPWPWWALQLACRLCEAGMGVPLALLGLYPVFRSPREAWCRCCGRLLCFSPERVAAKAQILPGNFQWALSQHERFLPCDAITRSESSYLPLCSLPAEEPSDSLAGTEGVSRSLLSVTIDASDPTADFRPPSPIDLRRSIDEALCSEGLLAASSSLSLSLSLSLGLAGAGPSGASSAGDLCRTASCAELAEPQGEGERESEGGASLPTSGPSSPLPLPSLEHGGGSPHKLPPAGADRSLLVLSPVVPGGSAAVPRTHGSPPRSPPPPGCQYWVLAPASQESLASAGKQQGAAAALLQEEFMDVCRQIDALSVSSDTIDL